MIFSHVDGYTAYFKVKMIRCRNCGEHMVDNSDGNLPGSAIPGLHSAGVKIDSSGLGICNECVMAGNYLVQCSLCRHYKRYPSEFGYILGCDAIPAFICTDCVANKPQEVIRLLADADDIEKVKAS